MYGNDYGYASTRIVQTIVRTKKGDPVYVISVGGDGVCYCCPIDKEWRVENADRIHLDELDMKPVRLGYVNTAGEASYIQRIPMRRDWKQGLRSENCHGSHRGLYAMPMKDVKNCILGIYPTFSTALKDSKVGVARGRVKVLAWHRHWALSSRGDVYYKDYQKVGDLDGDKVVLDKKFKYLEEYLAETLK